MIKLYDVKRVTGGKKRSKKPRKLLKGARQKGHGLKVGVNEVRWGVERGVRLGKNENPSKLEGECGHQKRPRPQEGTVLEH